jgi:5-methyltetrahydropteroyltriglutamate--homocysteine methyltransferase
MQRSNGRILTTHTGSLPRPNDLLEAMRAREIGGDFDQTAFDQRLKEAVAENVRQQIAAGIDIVNDGEVGKPSFQAYVLERMSGFEARPVPEGAARPSGPIDPNGRDAQQFPDYYEYVLAHSPFANTIRMAPACVSVQCAMWVSGWCSVTLRTSRRLRLA